MEPKARILEIGDIAIGDKVRVSSGGMFRNLVGVVEAFPDEDHALVSFNGINNAQKMAITRLTWQD